MPRFRWLILVLVLLLVLPACAKKETVPIIEEKPAEEVPPPPPPPVIEEEAEEPVEIEEEEPIVLEDVFFDYDKYNIKNKFKEVLARNAEILLSNPDVDLLVEGHCDERGTNEYNLALGERRPRAAHRPARVDERAVEVDEQALRLLDQRPGRVAHVAGGGAIAR